MELDQEHAAGLELAIAARVQQAPVRIESVARCVDGVGRLVVVARVSILFGQIRQVRDDEVDRLGERLEEVSLQHVHSILDTVELCIPARELDGGGARVGRPDLDLRAVHRERNGHGAAASADVRDAHRHSVDAFEGPVDECFRCRPGSEHLSRGR